MVPYREEGGKILYLVISSAVTKREHWEFPKGGVEEGEREVQTALRELQEETGVSQVRLLPGFREPIRYIYRRPEGLVSKQVVYFIGKVANPAVTLREVEAKDYRWATYDETYKLIRHANARILLERAHAFITGKPRPEGQDRRRQARPPQKVSTQAEALPKGPAQERAPHAGAPSAMPSPMPPLPAGGAHGAPPQERPSSALPGESPAASRGRRRRRRRRGRGQGGGTGQGPPPGAAS